MRLTRLFNVFVALAMVLGLAAFGFRAGNAAASSHREAPMISQDPVADNTDVYAFVSPDKPDTVTLIASFIPLEDPGNGPNFYKFGDDVLYEIHVDNVGDAQSHITYQFRFATQVTNPNSFNYNAGPIESIDSPNLNVKQAYSVTRLDDGKATTLGQNLKVPPVNVGPKSTPDYEALSNAGIQDLSDGSKVFAGQSDDPFFVDFSVFDLLTIRNLPGNKGGGVDHLKGYNVHTIALQIPKARLTRNGSVPTDPKDTNGIIGVWSTTSRQATRVLNAGGKPSSLSGDFVQVSRLGAPLVNEVVVPRGAKDLWNNSQPANDAQFLGGVTDPELGKLFKALYNIQVPPAPRDDLVAIFLTGIKGLNQPANVKPAEELRLNMAIPPSANPNPLGVVGGDNGGFPNGRRLADDVTDIELKGVAGAAYPLFHPDFKPDPLAAQLGDGVDANDVPYRAAFPYVGLAQCNTVCQNAGTAAMLSGYSKPLAAPPPAPAQPPSMGTTSGTTMQPAGMPRTGAADGEQSGNTYGLVLAALAVGGMGLFAGGWTLRRRTVSRKH